MRASQELPHGKPRNRLGASVRSRGGFSLVEAMIAVVVVAIAGVGIISAVTYARHCAEFDKHRLAAMAVGRRYIEEKVRNKVMLTHVEDESLDEFNTPDVLTDDLMATVDLEFYYVNGTGQHVDPDGNVEEYVLPQDEIDEINDRIAAEQTDLPLLEAVVTISWNRTGRLSSHRVSEVVRTYVKPGAMRQLEGGASEDILERGRGNE